MSGITSSEPLRLRRPAPSHVRIIDESLPGLRVLLRHHVLLFEHLLHHLLHHVHALLHHGETILHLRHCGTASSGAATPANLPHLSHHAVHCLHLLLHKLHMLAHLRHALWRVRPLRLTHDLVHLLESLFHLLSGLRLSRCLIRRDWFWCWRSGYWAADSEQHAQGNGKSDAIHIGLHRLARGFAASRLLSVVFGMQL